MKKKILLFCLTLSASLTTIAQAPVASFSLSTTPCLNQDFFPTNTSTGTPTLTFNWSIFPTTNTILPSSSAASPTITFGNTGNYTITLVATNTVGSSSFTMAINGVKTCPACLDTIRMIKNIDTLTTYAASNSSLTLGCQSGFSGFLTGTNCYKDKEFAQYFPASSYSNTPLPQVNSVIVLFDSLGTKATGATQATQIYCKIYGGTVGYGPNSIISIKGDSLGKIAASTNKTTTVTYCGSPTYTFATTKIIPFKFIFSTPTIIPATGFFASVQTPFSSAVDSIKIFSNTKTNLSNDSSSWVLQYSNNWKTIRYNKNHKIQLAILPIISCRPVAGVHENTTDFNSNITVMPNPSNGEFSLIFTLTKQENVMVNIFNPLGQLISTDKLENVKNNLINIDLRNRSQGIYFIEITNGNEKVLKKIIITN
ncbi:MAG: T9SS type A sorting domain-containing protein [Bacteroidota bacterium]|nr:T9SS type A sorting domain-containing protein [Bacteroidota bacterium]MDP3146452.1 T9SS type A sorting domain-containing protein [Bacteroidota bacterium]MDP3557438.1 T9SS type A sorting domain-containing protein [Bacteroidota bacterium]